MIAKLINIKGRVQRVGYRRYILDNAQDLNISGYVKNFIDGSVAIFAQGNDDNINRFIDIIKNPPKPIVIRSIDIEDASIDESLRYFVIKYGDMAEELQEGFGAMESIFYNYWDEFREFRGENKEGQEKMFNEMRGLRQELLAILDERLRKIEDDIARIKTKLNL